MKTLKADVAIVSAGTAGLAAAVAAAEAGAKVIAIDKAPTVGGTGNMAGGLFAVGTKLQRQKFIDLSKDQAFRIFMDYTRWRVDAVLVRKYIDKSADTVDWLEDMGVKFYDVVKHNPSCQPVWHTVKPSDPNVATHNQSSGLIKSMKERADALGVEFLLGTRVKSVAVEGGAVQGVVAEAKDGGEIAVECRAAIVATGGFGNNPAMIKELCGLEWGKDIFNARVPGADGDGLRMAWAAGAARAPAYMELNYGISFKVNEAYPDVGRAFKQPNLLVNALGERFIDEALMEDCTAASNALLRQPGKVAYSIIDESIKRHYRKNGIDFINYSFPTFYLRDLDEQLQAASMADSPEVFMADGIEGLADALGIDRARLVETVEAYNEACASRDAVFAKRHEYLRPIRKGPFYAGKLTVGGYGSMGGIPTNHRLEVTKEDGSALAGLYAAGTDACNIYAESYVFILPGNTLGWAVNSGRMAGENAADFALSG